MIDTLEPKSQVNAHVTGGCLCGAVRYSATLKGRDVSACHCRMCLRWAGGPFMAVEVAQDLVFENAWEIAAYRSSEWAERGFCRRCGTALFWRMLDGSDTALCAGTIDDQAGLTLATEIFIDEKPGYYDFANPTTRLTGQQVIEMYGAGQEKG